MRIFFGSVISLLIQRYKHITLFLLLLLTGLFLVTGCKNETPTSNNRLFIFAGIAAKPPLDEIVTMFERKNNVKVDVSYGGSGDMLSQIKLTNKGDVYIPATSDWIDKAVDEKIVTSESKSPVAYLIPVICVQKGNPKNISSVKDLAKPGVRLVMANPENVALGVFSVEIFEKALDKKSLNVLKKNIVNYAPNAEKALNQVLLKQADATIGWNIFKYWGGSRVQVIDMKHEIQRIGYISAGTIKFSNNKKMASRFNDFLLIEGRQIFKKHHYIVDSKTIFKYFGPQKNKPLFGGDYKVPDDWIAR